MNVADNDAGTKDGEAGKTDAAHGVFLHPHDANITKPASGGASYRRQQAELGDSGDMAAARKGADDADFETLQVVFTPAHRSGTDTGTAHGASRALAQHFAGKGGRALG